MQFLAPFLLSITGSIAARVLTSLGIGIFSYAALTTLTATVISNITSNFNALPVAALAIVNLAGGGQAIAIICAALVTRASLSTIKSMRPT